MKRLSLYTAALLLLSLLTSCNLSNSTNTITVKNWSDVVQEDTSNPPNLQENSPSLDAIEDAVIEKDSTKESTTSDTDNNFVDLTKLSPTMLYAKVYHLVMYPDEYIGKTIKMTGTMSVWEDPATQITYFATIISDSTACCMQGIEFVLTDDYAYPEDYPEVGMNVTVVGEFETYYEGEYLYCRLKNATLQ